MSNKGLLTVALCLGLLTSGLVYSYIGSLSAADKSEPRRETETVLVATRRLAPSTEVTEQMLRVADVSADYVAAGALRAPEQAIGRIVREPVESGEQLLDSSLFRRGEQPGLAFRIPSGMRAVTVAVDEVVGVAGFVKTGDSVDVLATFDEQAIGDAITVTLLQGVEVLAIAQQMNADLNDRAQVVTTVTLAVTLQQAEQLTLASEEGRLRLALRPYDAPKAPTGPALASHITGRKAAPSAPAADPAPDRIPPRPTPRPSPPPERRPAPPPAVSVEVIRGTEKEVVELP